jgi:hypothetical protein
MAASILVFKPGSGPYETLTPSEQKNQEYAMSRAVQLVERSARAVPALIALLASSAMAETQVTAPAKIPGTQSCLLLSSIDSSQVLDDKTIIFRMRGGKQRYYKNTLPYKCPGLGFQQAYSHKTSLNQLCSVDIITVLETGGGLHEGASCGLGSFEPYTPPVKVKK